MGSRGEWYSRWDRCSVCSSPPTGTAASRTRAWGFANALPAILLLTANVPSIYYWGTLAYLLASGLCNARYVALALDVVGPDIRDASTWYSALLGAGNIPIVPMIWLEGRMFHRFGTHGLLWTDAAANVVVFAVVAAVFVSRGLGMRPARPTAAENRAI